MQMIISSDEFEPSNIDDNSLYEEWMISSLVDLCHFINYQSIFSYSFHALNETLLKTYLWIHTKNHISLFI